MCQAIRFTIHNKPITVFFTDPNPCAPVLMRNGNIQIMPWGNPSEKFSFFPPGSTVHSDDIKLGKYKNHRPRFVTVVCQAYMLLDEHQQEVWFDLDDSGHQGLKAMIATVNDKDRVFFIMRTAELLDHKGFNDWPIPAHIIDYIHPKNKN